MGFLSVRPEDDAAVNRSYHCHICFPFKPASAIATRDRKLNKNYSVFQYTFDGSNTLEKRNKQEMEKISLK